MKHRAEYLTGLFWGGGIGGAIGLFICVSTVNGSNNSNGFNLSLGMASLLVATIIGAVPGLIVVYSMNKEYDSINENNHTRRPLDYFDSAIIGALIGGVLGIMICNFACIGESGNFNNVSGIFWGAFFLMAIFGVIISPVVTHFYNKETERINGENRRQQEYEAECTLIQNQINNAFIKTGQNLRFAEGVLKCIEDHKNSSTYMDILNIEVSPYEERIYNETLIAWSSGSFKAAELGLKILSEVFSFKDQYKNALLRLQDKRKLLSLMAQNGLPSSSPLMKKFSIIFD